MPVITLTSDWGDHDHYTAAVKGVILSLRPDITIIDISHSIPRFDLNETAFVLKNAWSFFPKGSVHIIAVNTEASPKTPHTVVFYKGHYFIAADTGIFSLMLDGEPDSIYEITATQDSDYFTFPTRDVFAKVAVHLASGNSLEEIGTPLKEINRLKTFTPVADKDGIRGVVIHIDSYENAVTNIPEDMFLNTFKGTKFVIYARREEIFTIHKSYGDVPRGDIVAVFGASGLLEIAMNQGKACSLLGISIGDAIRIELHSLK